MATTRSPGSKIVISSWWIFILLMVNSYTANLAAFQTVSRIPIKIGEMIKEREKESERERERERERESESE